MAEINKELLPGTKGFEDALAQLQSYKTLQAITLITTRSIEFSVAQHIRAASILPAVNRVRIDLYALYCTGLASLQTKLVMTQRKLRRYTSS